MNGICEEIPEIIANKIILMAMEMKNFKINKLIKYTPTPKNKKKNEFECYSNNQLS